MHLLRRASGDGARVQLLGLGHDPARGAGGRRPARDDFGVEADVWSATSFTELRRDGHGGRALEPAAPRRGAAARRTSSERSTAAPARSSRRPTTSARSPDQIRPYVGDAVHGARHRRLRAQRLARQRCAASSRSTATTSCSPRCSALGERRGRAQKAIEKYEHRHRGGAPPWRRLTAGHGPGHRRLHRRPGDRDPRRRRATRSRTRTRSSRSSPTRRRWRSRRRSPASSRSCWSARRQGLEGHAAIAHARGRRRRGRRAADAARRRAPRRPSAPAAAAPSRQAAAPEPPLRPPQRAAPRRRRRRTPSLRVARRAAWPASSASTYRRPGQRPQGPDHGRDVTEGRRAAPPRRRRRGGARPAALAAGRLREVRRGRARRR